jgi:sec-independent protein translocase protein TatB
MVVSPPILAANLGMADSLILMIMALVVFGPRRLPQIGRQVGKLMFELRKASNDFKFQMEDELKKADDFERQKEEERKRIQEAQAATLAAPAPLGVVGPPDPYADLNPPAAAEPAGEAEAPAESAPTEETGLQVQPPSTGEIVPADRPGSSAADEAQSAEAERAAAADATVIETPPEAAEDVKAEITACERSYIEKAAVAETLAVTEPAAHNG